MSLFDKISILRELKNKNSELNSKINKLNRALNKSSADEKSNITFKKFDKYKKRLTLLEKEEERLITIIKRINIDSEKLLSD